MEYSCGAIVYTTMNNEYKYLVIKQRYANHYGFAKGHMEDNETKVQTAVREVFEETGINIEIDESKYEVIYYDPKPFVTKEVTYFLAKAINNDYTIQEEEILEIHWLNKTEVLSILTHENDKFVFKSLSSHLE